MTDALPLRPVQRRALLDHYRRDPGPAVRLRAHVILMLAAGYPWSLIRAALSCSSRTVARWKRRFEERGVQAVLGRPRGSPCRWSEGATAILRDALGHAPDQLAYPAVNWTAPLLREHIEKVWGQKRSDREVRRQLRHLKYVWKRPRHAIRESRSPRVRRRLRRIRQKVRDLPAGCAKLFEDETDLLLSPPLRAGWFLRGKPAGVPISGQNARRVIFGTTDGETGQRVFIARREPCAPDFRALLPLTRKGYGDREVALLSDKASRPTAQEPERLAARLGIELIWPPPRSANVNPMDRLWKWGKEKTCANRQHASIDYQADFFIDYLLGLSPEEALRKAGIFSKRFGLFR